MNEPNINFDIQPLLKSQTEIVEQGLVGIETTPIGPQDNDMLRREIQDLSELYFLLPDFLFCPFTFCNVLARDQDNRIVRPKDGSGRFANPKHRAVLAHLAELPSHRLAELF